MSIEIILLFVIQYWTAILQVRCDEDTVSTSIGSQRNKPSNFFQHLGEQLTNLEQGPIHVRAKRSVDNDQCHSLQTKVGFQD